MSADCTPIEAKAGPNHIFKKMEVLDAVKGRFGKLDTCEKGPETKTCIIWANELWIWKVEAETKLTSGKPASYS